MIDAGLCAHLACYSRDDSPQEQDSHNARKKVMDCIKELETLVGDDKKWPSKLSKMRTRVTIDAFSKEIDG